MTHDEFTHFLAHALALESEAQERYTELASSMAAHHNQPVAAFFESMARESEQHLREVKTLANQQTLPQLKPWEYQWPAQEAPESASYEAVHYRMDLREAMQLALSREYEAADYYLQFSKNATDSKTRSTAAGFAAEEQQHAAALEQKIAGLATSPGQYQREEDDAPNLPE